jgi:glycosyltransferase involved in cell wall biosynthesis
MYRINNAKKFNMKFSVSMSAYKEDKPEHILSAINSVIKQTVIPDEVVLVIDGFIQKDVFDVINNLKSKNKILKVIELKENTGHGNARRVGLENCSYDLVAIMDSDDISVEDRFEKQIKCFKEDKKLKVVGGQIYEFINDISNIVSIRNVPLRDKDIKNYLKYRCPFNQTSVMFDKVAVLKAGGYLDWFQNEDYYLWIRMYQAGYKFLNLKDNLVYVRIGDNMFQKRGGFKYFNSEAKLQKYMYDEDIISFYIYLFNLLIRFFTGDYTAKVKEGFFSKII